MVQSAHTVAEVPGYIPEQNQAELLEAQLIWRKMDGKPRGIASELLGGSFFII
jgi:hypothetical protein